MKEFTTDLIAAFEVRANPVIAAGQKAYMKDRSEFFGVKSPERREVQRPFFTKENRPLKNEVEGVVRELWLQPQREMQYVAQELLAKYVKQLEERDIDLLEFMITHKSWWDTVDFIAANLVGPLFKTNHDLRNEYIDKWLDSENIWLQRTCILFQLKYKEDLNTELLSAIIQYIPPTKEFFINKAIGWILREYAKTDREWVINFVK